MSLMIYTPVDLIVGGEEEIQKEEVGLDVTVWSLPFTAAVLEMAIEVNGNELRRRYQWYHTIPQYLVRNGRVPHHTTPQSRGTRPGTYSQQGFHYF